MGSIPQFYPARPPAVNQKINKKQLDVSADEKVEKVLDIELRYAVRYNHDISETNLELTIEKLAAQGLGNLPRLRSAGLPCESGGAMAGSSYASRILIGDLLKASVKHADERKHRKG